MLFFRRCHTARYLKFMAKATVSPLISAANTWVIKFMRSIASPSRSHHNAFWLFAVPELPVRSIIYSNCKVNEINLRLNCTALVFWKWLILGLFSIHILCLYSSYFLYGSFCVTVHSIESKCFFSPDCLDKARIRNDEAVLFLHDIAKRTKPKTNKKRKSDERWSSKPKLVKTFVYQAQCILNIYYTCTTNRALTIATIRRILILEIDK